MATRNRQTKWDRVNLILALILMLVVFGVAGKVGHDWYAENVVHSSRAVKVAKTQPSSDLSAIKITKVHYQTSADFMKWPALVVTYQMVNRSSQNALPGFVFNQRVQFHQLTATNTDSVLAASDLKAGQLTGVQANYFENQDILLLPNQQVTVVQTYRLESLKRPVKVKFSQSGETQTLKPWRLRQVTAHD